MAGVAEASLGQLWLVAGSLTGTTADIQNDRATLLAGKKMLPRKAVENQEKQPRGWVMYFSGFGPCRSTVLSQRRDCCLYSV